MTNFNLRSILRNRLTRRKNPQYLSWIASQKGILVGHHFTGSDFKKKLHDLLIAPIPDEVHQKIENGIPVDGYSEEELLLLCIEWNHRYIVCLQNQINELEKS